MERAQRVQRVTDKQKALAQLAALKKGGIKRSDQFDVRADSLALAFAALRACRRP